jgi:hypothetical protein
VLLHCFAGGHLEDIAAGLGLELQALFPPDEDKSRKSRAKVAAGFREAVSELVAAYDYTDESGTVLYQNCRYRLKDGGKDFRQRRPTPSGWLYNVGNTRRVPYRLPAVLEAVAMERAVYLVEGEKDADRLAGLGLAATTSGSASSWKPELVPCFTGADVVIVQDLDKAGDAYRDTVGASLAGVAKRVRVVWLPVEWRETHGLDVSDWLDSYGGTLAELERLAEVAPAWQSGMGSKPKASQTVLSMTELLAKEFEPIRWIVQGILPEGLVILAGKPKLGKSWLAFDLCIAVASGGRAFGLNRPVNQGSVLYLALEDNNRRLQTRCRKLLESEQEGIDLSRFDYLTECPKANDGGLLVIEGWIKSKPDSRLIVVDTLAKIRPPRKKGADSYEEDYAAMQGLKSLADKYRVAIVVVHHARKAAADDPLDAISGTTGLSGGVDGGLVLRRERGAAAAFLYVSGRDIEEETDLALNWNAATCRWSVVGTAAEFKISQDHAAVRQVLVESDEPMRPRDVWDALRHSDRELSIFSVKRRLLSLLKDGLVVQPKYGFYWVTR